jgi:pyruvate/2-oxoglutarate dehydrogenase complex dihydrolipoamide acyltransferase (E2) component
LQIKAESVATRMLTCSGDSFSAGDVLLEIETDKAQMDVEAQDDGILAKIIVRDDTEDL